MSEALPLPTLLGPALVAFTVEFDNEFEHQMVHRTTSGGEQRGPWLGSQVLWANVLRYIPDDGIAVPELHARARTERTLLAGLERWGYVEVGPGQGDRDPVVRPKPWGRRARSVWAPLAGQIEDRWSERLGRAPVARLRDALTAVVSRLGLTLPDHLPPVHPAQGGRAETRDKPPAGEARAVDDLELSALLSKTLHAFTIDFEQEADLSLAMCAATLRVAADSGVRVRDLPRLTGVSKEAHQMCIGFFERHRRITVEPDPSSARGKIIRLTPAGKKAQDKYRRVLAVTEATWTERFGEERISELRSALEAVVGPSPTLAHSPLFEGLEPRPGGWRSRVPRPETLPHYPMILHRGGYPDGS